ncbi:MAG TPA: peptidylprolyl isomerase [Bryobacteraceae bacterium]|nr:peptidylprolyl isomerase [Bryobacteraceae bacterium]
MKAFFLLAVLCAPAGWAQSTAPAAAPKPDAVIVTFGDGTTMTQAELAALIPTLPLNYQEMAQQDPQHFLTVYAKFKKLAEMAEEQKLVEKTPYKQGVAFWNTAGLAQAEFMEVTSGFNITSEEIEKYYNDHKGPYRRMKVSGLKVAFGDPTAETAAAPANASRVPKKALTEEEAKAKAEKLVSEIRAGADFAKLVQLESDDEASKAKGGDLGVWKMTDNVPDDLRTGVMSLEEGQVSDPIRQAGGFFIMHVDAVTYAPLDEVKDAVFDQLKQEKARQWLAQLDKSIKVEFPKNDPPPAAPDTKK